eukprot:TRINITY_DN31340_c0_g1_i1.p1 TRINITY_DN31340_c0_g1~~TRINITY_DN31340_c0_g1_i1.p1  ORF type:complete len:1169 (-),score=143.26 TRINITY_DN31340_c0_g1_i1:5-3481(-)
MAAFLSDLVWLQRLQAEQEKLMQHAAAPSPDARGKKLAATQQSPATQATRSLRPYLSVDDDEVVEQEAKRPAAEDEVHAMARETVSETVSEDVFVAYGSAGLNIGAPHPGAIVEALSLAAAPLPTPTYPILDSLKEAIDSGSLSSLQVEGILYACQRHLHILSSGRRAGFFIGDQTGVGKGRQIAGIILDNAARGRTRHVWFSTSADLRVDAERDLRNVGCHLPVINGCRQLQQERKAFGLSSDMKEGILFSTYTALITAVGGRTKGSDPTLTRMLQLAEWCGGTDFDGCLVFDECHKAKNYVPNKENASTKIAWSVVELQRFLPRARVVYCSATGVSDLPNLAYMDRLGLWGEGTAFPGFESFREAFARRGVGVLELLAVEMKTAGIYVARGLGFQDCLFESLHCALTSAQVEIYDKAAQLWSEIRRALHKRNATGKLWRAYWAAHQRFFKQLLISLKVPHVVAEAKAALRDGNCVVIGLQTTGEAALDKEFGALSVLERTSASPKLLSLTQEIALCFIDNNLESTSVPLPENSSIEALIQQRDDDHSPSRLRDAVLKLALPPSPLDDLIDKLGGVDNVAEMTGRKGRLVKTAVGFQYQLRSKAVSADMDQVNLIERDAFMSGKKLIAIISDAASTGISLHADRTVANTRRRVHITLELAWSADKTIQQLGRSHRTNQVCAPVYKLANTGIGGERRFVAAVSKRLESLGALRGDRRSAVSADLYGTNIDTRYGLSALRLVISCVNAHPLELPTGLSVASVRQSAEVPSWYAVSTTEFQSECQMAIAEMGGPEEVQQDVKRFLNRMLGLPIRRQQLLFSLFCGTLTQVIQAARQSGRYDEGITDLRGESIKMEGPPVELAQGTVPTTYTLLRVDRGISWEKAVERRKTLVGEYDGFYKSVREFYGAPMFVLAWQRTGGSFMICRPNTGVSFFEEEKESLLAKYTKVPDEAAEAGWSRQYSATAKVCIHGGTCRFGPQCSVGVRHSQVCILRGAVLPLWGSLQKVLDAHAATLPKADLSLRVVRAELDTGKRIVGVRFPVVFLEEARVLALQSDTSTQIRGKTEAVTCVQQKCLLRVGRKAKTMKDFFATKKRPRSPSPDNQLKLAHRQIVSVDEDEPPVASSAPDREMACPNCAFKFAPTATNFEINQHIDACLESSA